MKVSELMQTRLHTIGPDDRIADSIVTIAEAHVSALPVVDSRHHLVGVVSTSDLLEAEASCSGPEERERLFDETTVREIMTPRPVTIEPGADVRDAARHMLYLEVHRLFVEDSGALVGVISQTDVVRAVATAKV